MRVWQPPAPQFVNRKRPFGDTDGELFYVIKHGIRLTEQRGGQLALLVRYTWIAGKRAAGLISSGPLDRGQPITALIATENIE